MGGPKGINWELALEFYLTPSLEGKLPSYQDVADKFGVSKKEVGLKAKKENWLQRRQNVYDQAEETYTDNRVQLIKQTVQKHIKSWQTVQSIADSSLDQIEEEMNCGEFKSSQINRLVKLTRVFKVAIEGERTALGLPNSIKYAATQNTTGEIILPIELVQEIDCLFEINKNESIL